MTCPSQLQSQYWLGIWGDITVVEGQRCKLDHNGKFDGKFYILCTYISRV